MQLSKTQITALLTEVASQEDGFNELLRMSFEALMKAERQEHLYQSEGDKGNGFRQVKAYGRGKLIVSQWEILCKLYPESKAYKRYMADRRRLVSARYGSTHIDRS